jgi:hypothetical protein
VVRFGVSVTVSGNGNANGCGYSRINYDMASALLRLHRPREAVAILQPVIRNPTIEGSNLYVTRTEVHELLGRAWDEAGVPDSAVAHYRAVTHAWSRADPLPRKRAEATPFGWSSAVCRSGSPSRSAVTCRRRDRRKPEGAVVRGNGTHVVRSVRPAPSSTKADRRAGRRRARRSGRGRESWLRMACGEDVAMRDLMQLIEARAARCVAR